MCCVVNMVEELIVSADVASGLDGVTCKQQEADRRLVLHVLDMVEHGAATVKIRTVDGDDLVFAVSYFWFLKKALAPVWNFAP